MTDLVSAFAEGFLLQYGEDCGTRLFDIAPLLGLSIQEVDSDSFDGALLRIKGCSAGLVAIRKSIREPARKLFALAHELGHYLLPNQQDLTSPCHPAVLERWNGLPAHELEANRFAAEILMPRRALSSVLRQEPSLELVREISAKFRTSFTAAAYRLIELTTFRVAMVVSMSGKALWYRASPEFGRAIRLGPLDQKTFAHDWFDGGALPLGPEHVPAAAWLHESNLRADARVWEHSIGLPTYQSVLSLLYLKDRVEVHADSDDEEDGELDPVEFSLKRSRWPGK
jgi:hypothetical protein